jgi:hypothetical protein
MISRTIYHHVVRFLPHNQGYILGWKGRKTKGSKKTKQHLTRKAIPAKKKKTSSSIISRSSLKEIIIKKKWINRRDEQVFYVA